jgi:hypothetical protein
MTQEEKSLLLKDLCARLPYGVKVTWDGKHPLTVTPHIYCAILSEDNINNLPKLLLRPISSMTEEEKNEHFGRTMTIDIVQTSKEVIDWLNAHHFDYNGLIEKGLALEAPEGMYNQNKKCMKLINYEYNN